MAEKLTRAQRRIVAANPLAAKLVNGSTDRDGCWLFGPERAGYGTIQTPSGTRKAHRVSFGVFVGPIPEGLFVCHHCDTPRCVRPHHLFLGTASDNMRDMVRKNRAKGGITSKQDHFKNGCPRGGDASGARLTREQAVDIIKRAADGVLTTDLATEHAVERSTIQRLLSGATWRDLPRPPGLPRPTGKYVRRAALETEEPRA